MDNSTDAGAESKCIKKLYQHSQNRIGLDQTFEFSAILFFVVGMGFGTSYSITHVDCLDWVHTGYWKRVARGLLGVTITGGLFILIKTTTIIDPDTHYFIHHALPALSFSLFIYGLFPLICKRIGLVDDSSHIFDEQSKSQIAVIASNLPSERRRVLS